MIRRECPDCGGPYIAHCIPCTEKAAAAKNAVNRPRTPETTKEPSRPYESDEECRRRKIDELFAQS